jgi:hypothetical protein
MREVIREVIKQHKKEKMPLAVWNWKAQKVTFISPEAALRKSKKKAGMEN